MRRRYGESQEAALRRSTDYAVRNRFFAFIARVFGWIGYRIGQFLMYALAAINLQDGSNMVLGGLFLLAALLLRHTSMIRQELRFSRAAQVEMLIRNENPEAAMDEMELPVVR